MQDTHPCWIDGVGPTCQGEKPYAYGRGADETDQETDPGAHISHKRHDLRPRHDGQLEGLLHVANGIMVHLREKRHLRREGDKTDGGKSPFSLSLSALRFPSAAGESTASAASDGGGGKRKSCLSPPFRSRPAPRRQVCRRPPGQAAHRAVTGRNAMRDRLPREPQLELGVPPRRERDAGARVGGQLGRFGHLASVADVSGGNELCVDAVEALFLFLSLPLSLPLASWLPNCPVRLSCCC